ncbi:putative serine/threonine-protein kinase RLCKVII-like [Dorcoceras hygrometricum]|uniref:Putative serine/threonine-protein kinase RLCKVII-like n=1 Tax=Dorcoceras hygrometricum TaxID=472368 RepID=A0A2Z7CIU9_9LAMI|nr:putative serine/threonine-protein kinase RLCKVII-like [Dorcoceras hygrometricum]
MLNTLSRVSVRESRIQYLCDPQWFRETASRGPTTIVAPESQFRTCPSDHDSIGYPRMSASGESSTTMHRLLHASGSHPILPPDDPKTNQYNQDLGLIHSTNGNHLESLKEGSSIDHQRPARVATLPAFVAASSSSGREVAQRVQPAALRPASRRHESRGVAAQARASPPNWRSTSVDQRFQHRPSSRESGARTAHHRPHIARGHRATIAPARAFMRLGGRRRGARRRPDGRIKVSILKFNRLDTIMANRIDQIRENTCSDTTVEDPDPPPRLDCGSLRQSGPRPDPRLLRQAALEGLTRSARTDSPRRTGRKQIFGKDRRRRRRRVGGGGGGVNRKREAAVMC